MEVPPKPPDESKGSPPKGKGKGKGPPPPAPETATEKGKGPKGPPKGEGKGEKGKGEKGKGKGKGPSEGSEASEPRKADVKPRIPMKKLFWNSFILHGAALEQPRATVWGSIDQDGSDSFDIEELEGLFCEAGANKALNTHPADAEAPKRPVKLRILAEARRRQVCVMLARLPGVEATIKGIREMDESKLDKDQVELLLANLPSNEELASLKDAAADYLKTTKEPPPWDDAEAFILKLAEVPHFALRLQLWTFENCHEERFELFQSSAAQVQAACSALLQSRRVQRLLAMTLSVGNYMNGGTARGRADGFSIEALNQIRTIKAQKAGPATTLLDFLVRQLEKNKPGDLDGLFQETAVASMVRLAARVKLPDVAQELTGYRNQVEGLGNRAKASNDPILQAHAERCSKIQAELAELQLKFAEADQEYKRVCEWLHEGAAKAPRPCDELLGIWDGFFQAVKAALDAGRPRRVRKARTEAPRSVPKRSMASFRRALSRSLSNGDVNLDDEALTSQDVSRMSSNAGP